VPQSTAITIATSSAADLRSHSLAQGIPIPTLVETLESIGSSANVFVEIKARDIEPLVVRCIRESGADCAVHSFDHRIVSTVKKIFPAIRCGVLEVARHVDPVAPLEATGAEDLWQHVDYIDEELVALTHARGARVIAWTANDAAQWPALIRMGVDGICTDQVRKLAAAFA
jgi:glycerophosphoryl diester phosphodiesterase